MNLERVRSGAHEPCQEYNSLKMKDLDIGLGELMSLGEVEQLSQRRPQKCAFRPYFHWLDLRVLFRKEEGIFTGQNDSRPDTEIRPRWQRTHQSEAK